MPVFAYHIATDVWSTMPSIPVPSWSMKWSTAFSVAGNVFIRGTIWEKGDRQPTCQERVEHERLYMLDYTQSRWVRLAGGAAPEAEHSLWASPVVFSTAEVC